MEAYGDTKKVKLASPGDELSGEKEQFMGKRKRMITNGMEIFNISRDGNYMMGVYIPRNRAILW